jgi:hypothetical protein
LKIVINFIKSILTILSPSVTHTRQHACNTCEAFPLKCWSPSDDGPSLAETCKGLILLLKALLRLMEFKLNLTYILRTFGEVPHRAFFSCLMPRPSFHVQILPSAPRSRTLSIRVPYFM